MRVVVRVLSLWFHIIIKNSFYAVYFQPYSPETARRKRREREITTDLCSGQSSNHQRQRGKTQRPRRSRAAQARLPPAEQAINIGSQHTRRLLHESAEVGSELKFGSIVVTQGIKVRAAQSQMAFIPQGMQEASSSQRFAEQQTGLTPRAVPQPQSQERAAKGASSMA